jgi:hypothetical protein
MSLKFRPLPAYKWRLPAAYYRMGNHCQVKKTAYSKNTLSINRINKKGVTVSL